MKKTTSFVGLILLCTSVHAWAGPEGHKQIPMPKDFDTLKGLVGTWEGKTMMEGKETPMTVTYALTSGGTALTETMNPGTPHEMVSIYHREGKTLGMTHYCAMGNQPHLTLKTAEKDRMSFEVMKPVGIDSMKEHHMHALTISWAGPDTIKQEWTSFEKGQKQGTMAMDFKRKK